jgi:hypothetical protein
MDPAMAIIFVTFLVLVPVLSVFFGAESRPGFLRPERKPRPMVGSMNPRDWPPS